MTVKTKPKAKPPSKIPAALPNPNPWRPIAQLGVDNMLVEMRLEAPLGRERLDVVRGYRSSTAFAGRVTYWSRLDGRLTMIKPVSYREFGAPSGAAADVPATSASPKDEAA